jgi:hypothetical protein
MWEGIFTALPIGLALALVTFGSYGRRRRVAPTPGRIVPLVLAAVLLGPVLLSAVGFFSWLLVLAILVAAVLMVTMLRAPAPPIRR